MPAAMSTRIALGILIVAAIVGGAFWYSSTVQEQHRRDADAAIRNLNAEAARSVRAADAELVEARAHMAELRYGDAAGSLYRLCHKYPPTTKEHQQKCKALDDRMARDDAKDAKHPW